MSDVLVLCYHGVSASWPSSLAVSPQALRRQLTGLVRRGYRGATFERALSAPFSRTLAVTFDDACRSVFIEARPLLAELGLPGSVYVPTDFAGSSEPMCWSGIEAWREGPHADELLPMSWDQLGQLADEGWEVGSHSCSHPHLPALSGERLSIELVESRRTLEGALGCPCTSIAYPYGDVNRDVVVAAREAGYRVGASLGSDRRAIPLDWPRVGVYRRDALWRFRLKSAHTVRRLRTRSAPLALSAD